MKSLWSWSGAAAVLWLLACAVPNRARAEEAEVGVKDDVRNTSGLAVSVGAGYAAGGVPGGQLAYFLEFGHPRLRFGGLLGMGLAFPTDAQSTDEPADRIDYAVGAFGSFGKRSHRLYFDLSAASNPVSYGDAFADRVWAILGGTGWEVLTRRGFLMRASLAAGPRFLWGSLWEPRDRLAVRALLTLGSKLW